MRVSTPDGFWTLPSLRALWVPPGTVHGIQMVGKVSMRTLYVHANAADALWDRCQVVEVSSLLRELILDAAVGNTVERLRHRDLGHRAFDRAQRAGIEHIVATVDPQLGLCQVHRKRVG